MPIFPWQRSKENEQEITISLPEEEQKKIDAAAAASAELPAIKERLAALDDIQLFIKEQREDKQKAAAAEAAKQRQQQSQEGDRELEELMLTDPKAAIDRATQGQKELIFQLRADNIKREVLDSNPERFKYYHGDIKSEVDKLLAIQNLAARNDPSVVENCYLTVVGRHHEEIMDGKIKSRFAGAESGSRGTSSGSAGSSSAIDRSSRVIPDDVVAIAKKFGMKPEDYADLLDKEGIGYA